MTKDTATKDAAVARQPDTPIAPMFTARWSPRVFADTAMTEAQVMTLLEAARWAPSASNVQPWRVAWALRGDQAFDAIFGCLSPGNQAWAGRAAALIVMASCTTRTASDGTQVANPSHAFDAGAAWVSMAFQANLSGLVSHAMGGFDGPSLSAALSLPAGHALHAVVAVGYPVAPEALTEDQRQRERPNSRRAVAQWARRGGFAAP